MAEDLKVVRTTQRLYEIGPNNVHGLGSGLNIGVKVLYNHKGLNNAPSLHISFVIFI